MGKKIIIGSRGSKLALVQTESVAAAIRNYNPDVEVSISRITTKGDRNYHVPLETVAGQGIFVKELEEALLDGRVDIAVHSLKDMPTELPEGLCLAAVAERSDPRDVLVSREGKKLAELPSGARIGTGSLRRVAQLAVIRPDLKAGSIRGNVDTRLNKVAEGEFDGVILAAAAFKRLGWEDRITEYLPVESFLPAVGQAALAIEARSDDEETSRIVSPLNHIATWHSITAERAFLRALGGGCQAPIAASGTVSGDTLHLTGMTIDVNGSKMLRGTETGEASAAEEIGTRLAQRLLAEGADRFLSP